MKPSRLNSNSFRRDRSRSARDLPRSGFTIIEVVGTCILIGALFTVVVPMLLVVARERHSAEQRQFAMQHAVNLLEHASAVDWPELAAGRLEAPPPDGDASIVLPGLEQTLAVKRPDGELDARQIIASIRWRDRRGELQAPLVVSTWVYPTSEVSP